MFSPPSRRSVSPLDGRVVLNGPALKKLRQQQGLSQEALAELCQQQHLCVSIASIKRAEAGRCVLYRTARHLAAVHQVPLDGLADVQATQVVVPAQQHPQPPLLGRRAEVQQFRALLQMAWSSVDAHVVCVRGAAGIGKSRLVAELTDIARHERFGVHAAVVASHADGSVPHQFTRSLLEATLAPAAQRPQPIEPWHATMVLNALVQREAQRRPLVMVIEDLHRGDSALFDALGLLLAGAAHVPVVWLLSSRLEQDPLERCLRPRCCELPWTVFDLAPLRAPPNLAHCATA
jgi:transcriptional regulator with XRE-family HTH domain